MSRDVDLPEPPRGRRGTVGAPRFRPGSSGAGRHDGVPMSEPEATLHVCITCRAGTEPLPGVPVPGAVLHDVAGRLLAERDGSGLRLLGVECLAVCRDGCAASISMPGKWSYLLGRLTPDKAADLLTFAASYRGSRTGTVMPSRRPASLADMVLGRVPA